MEVLHHIIVISLQNNIRQASFWSNNSSDDIYNLLKFPLQFSLVVMELNLQPLNPLLHQLLPLFMLSHPIIHPFLHCSFRLPKPLKHVWVILHFSNKAIQTSVNNLSFLLIPIKVVLMLCKRQKYRFYHTWIDRSYI